MAPILVALPPECLKEEGRQAGREGGREGGRKGEREREKERERKEERERKRGGKKRGVGEEGTKEQADRQWKAIDRERKDWVIGQKTFTTGTLQERKTREKRNLI